MTPADRLALEAIAECISKVRAYVQRAGDRWTADDMAVDAVAKRLEEIGELAKRLTLEAIARMPTVDWRGVKGMREVLAHDYGHVQVALIESVVLDDMDGLESDVTALLTASADEG